MKFLVLLFLFFGQLAANQHVDFPVYRFFNGHLLRNHQWLDEDLWVCNGVIIEPQPHADLSIDTQGAFIAPGFIDLQINGAFGCDFARNPENIDLVARRLPQFGVTAFLPTVISSSPTQYRKVLPLLQPTSFQLGATNLGIHLEGPFFSCQFNGAHGKHFICSDLDNITLEEMYGSLQGVKIVTLAPELPGALKKIQELTQRGIVVSAGHSNATFEQMQDGIQAGIHLATHLFNAMRPYHHRNGGIIGSVLFNPGTAYSVIADETHLSLETLALCWRCNPQQLLLVTDTIEAFGLPDGLYSLGENRVEVSQGKAYLAGTKTIAGSILSLDAAVRCLHRATHCSWIEALEAATLKPAQLIEIYPKKGSLQIGADADFIFLNDRLEVQATYIHGQSVWKANGKKAL